MLSLTQETVRKAGWAIGGLIALAVVVYPFIAEGDTLLRILATTFIFTGFATAWNLFSGYSGYLSLGHTAFFGTGGFLTTMLLVWFNLTPWIGMFIAAGVAVVFAVIIGLILFRLQDIYFALATLSVPLASIPVLVFLDFVEVSVPFQPDRALEMMSFRGVMPFYYLAFVLMMITIAVAWRVKHTRMGYYLRAIKGSEQAAESLGIDTKRYLIYALALSGFLSAFFGAVFVQLNFVMTPEMVFGLNPVIFSVVLPIAGGIGTVFGPVIGGLALFPLAEILRAELGGTIRGIHNLVFGVVVIFVILLLPNGIYTSGRQYILQWVKRRETAEEPAPETATDGGEDDPDGHAETDQEADSDE